MVRRSCERLVDLGLEDLIIKRYYIFFCVILDNFVKYKIIMFVFFKFDSI